MCFIFSSQATNRCLQCSCEASDYPPFKDEGAEVENLSDLPQTAEEGCIRGRIRIQAFSLPPIACPCYSSGLPLEGLLYPVKRASWPMGQEGMVYTALLQFSAPQRTLWGDYKCFISKTL